MSEDRLNGLPGPLPAGETIVWQGAPAFRHLLASAFHSRLIALYFLLLALGGAASGSLGGAVVTVAAGLACLGVVALIAYASARTSVYTLTEKRIVMRVGIALPTSINLPLREIDRADLRMLGDGCGDICVSLKGRGRIAYALLWPHARPWRLSRPEPMLRALPDAQDVARLLYRHCAALVDVQQAQAEPRLDASRDELPPTRLPQPVGAAA